MTHPTPIFRLLAVPIDDKGDALRALVRDVNVRREDVKREAGGEVFAVDPADFGQIRTDRPTFQVIPANQIAHRPLRRKAVTLRDRVNQRKCKVVAKVPPHCGQIEAAIDAMRHQPFTIADPGKHQQLRRRDRPGT